nr:hypothetical protein [Tanacetum cinerariifolium]
MKTLAEFMIIAGTDNCPPMLEKSMYDSWKSCMELYMENREKGRMILNLVQNVTKKLQADCDLKATNIFLEGLPSDVYAIVNHHKVSKEIWDRVKLLMQGTKLSLQERECKLYDKFDKFSYVKDLSLAVPVFTQGDDPIACLNKAMGFLSVVAALRVTVQQVQGRQEQSYVGTGYKGNATSSSGNNAGGLARVVKCYNCQGEGHMARQCTQPKRPRNAAWFKDKEMLAEAHEYGQILDEEQLAFLVDPCILDGQTTQTIILNNDFKETPVVDFPDNEITSYSNIIPYSQYLQETQQEAIQDANLYAQQDLMILSVIEQMFTQMINHVNYWEKANREKNNESLTAELEGYKERVKTFEQRLNIDLSTCEKMIDSQIDDMIKEKLAVKQQIDSLEQNLSDQIKEKEYLLQTYTAFFPYHIRLHHT